MCTTLSGAKIMVHYMDHGAQQKNYFVCLIDFTLNLSIAFEEIVHGALGGYGGKKGEENAENGEKNFPEHLLSAA